MGIILVLLVAGGSGCYWKFIRKHPPAVTANQNTKGEPLSPTPGSKSSGSSGAAGASASPASSAASAGSGTQSNTSSKQDQSPPPTTNVTLDPPSGDFVSSHTISLSAPEQSVCNTTPGATCTITFAQGSTSKSLAVENTDRGGSAYWNGWTPKSIGLTPGSWTIQATATLNGQSKTGTDARNLEVTQ